MGTTSYGRAMAMGSVIEVLDLFDDASEMKQTAEES